MSRGVDPIDFELRGEHITLDRLLKATGLVPSGGAAKTVIADGGVRVDGEVERRRGAKLRAGAVVAIGGQRVTLRPPKNETPPSPEAGGAGGFTANGAPEI